ncbi:hypothetical protein ACTFIW_001226 [Dictyostelium discoideum]
MKKRTRNNNNQEFYDDRIENNKKPKEDQIINNDSDTLMDDENNNNIKNYENEFKLFKLMNKEKLVIKKLQTIAKDNGLPFSGNENELYNRIEQYYNIKINSEKEVKQQQDNNPFNKSQPILLIKNDNEIAFWKVFRNKSIFKMVFSNFKFSNTFNYSRLYSVSTIFKSFSNGIEIIRDKVKSNSYLSFIASDKNNVRKFNFGGLSIIFENIKDENEENQVFYNQFITNYCNRTVHFWSLFDHVIESSNLLALKSLHGNGMIKEKVKVDFEINSYSNLKILNYLTKNLSKLFIIETIQVNDFNIFKEFKLAELIDFIRVLLDDKKYYKLLKPFTNFKSLSRATKDIDDELSLFLENITKNKLILNEIKNFKFTDKELNENLFKVLKPLTNWDRHFSKLNDKYSSSIDNNSSINNDNEIEIENEKQRLSIIKLKNLELFQKIVNNNDNLSKKLKLVSHEVHENIFNNIMIIQNDQIKIGKEMEGNFIEQNQLIQKIQEKQLKQQIEKENNTLQECKDDDLNKRNTIFKYVTIFYDLNLTKKKPIEYSLAFLNEFATNEEFCWDDQLFEFGIPKNEILVNGALSPNISGAKKIEIIMSSKFLMENKFKNFISTYCSRSLVENVKSTDMLDFLFEKFQNQIFGGNKDFWQYCDSVEILKHYEKLMESLGRKFSYSAHYPGIKFPLLSMAINNPFLYDDGDDYDENNNNNIKKKKKNLILKKNISFNDFLLLIESNRLKKLEMRKSLTEFNNDSILISRWISDNCITDLSSLIDHGRDFNTYSIKIEIDVQLPNYKGNRDGNDDGKVKLLLLQNQLIQILYNSNRLDDVFKINSLSGKEIIHFINFIGPHISLPFVEKLLQYLIDVNLNFEIYTFLSNLISNGNLLIIKYLNLNHSHFFSKITKETEGFLESRELKNLLSSSVLFDHVQIAEILFVYTNLTKGEFERSTKPSYSMIEFLYSNNFKLSK